MVMTNIGQKSAVNMKNAHIAALIKLHNIYIGFLMLKRSAMAPQNKGNKMIAMVLKADRIPI